VLKKHRTVDIGTSVVVVFLLIFSAPKGSVWEGGRGGAGYDRARRTTAGPAAGVPASRFNYLSFGIPLPTPLPSRWYRHHGTPHHSYCSSSSFPSRLRLFFSRRVAARTRVRTFVATGGRHTAPLESGSGHTALPGWATHTGLEPLIHDEKCDWARAAYYSEKTKLDLPHARYQTCTEI
jgi:hypothetical protein